METAAFSPSSPVKHHSPFAEQDERDPNMIIYHKRVNVPLEYPPMPLKEQANQPKAYPPLMSLSKEFNPSTSTNSLHSSPSPPVTPLCTSFVTTTAQSPNSTSPSPINIPQKRSPRSSTSSLVLERAGSMPSMSTTSFHSNNNSSNNNNNNKIDSNSQTQLPSPPTSPWKKIECSSSNNPGSKLTRSATMIVDETPYPELPSEVRAWTSSHVAEYLGYSLRFYPKAITQDLGRYVRQTACLNGAQFIDLEEDDLVRMEINLKWRSMIMKAVGILRRETVRASRMELMNWEDGFDPEKDTPVSSAASSYQDSTPFLSRSSSIRRRSSLANVIAESSTLANIPIPEETATTTTTTTATASTTQPNMPNSSNSDSKSVDDALRQNIVNDLKEVLYAWKREQEETIKKAATAAEASRSSLGFMEGVVIGGILVAFLLRFSR